MGMQVHASARGPNWDAEAPADHRPGPAGVPHVWYDLDALQKIISQLPRNRRADDVDSTFLELALTKRS